MSPLLLAFLLAVVIGIAHPQLPTLFCTVADGCRPVRTSVVADVQSRPSGANVNVLDVHYEAAGITTANGSLMLRLLGRDNHTLSPRVYLLAETGSRYQLVQLVHQELAFDVDVSHVGCGVNGALYLVEMDVAGGLLDGASHGTGYCDAQCPNSTCCNELDIWEANRDATALTSHACRQRGPFFCVDEQCGNSSSSSSSSSNSPCDRNGCGINPFRAVDPLFYRPGGSVDTRRPFTVVTRFVSQDNSTTGDLVQIRRLYIQDSRLITAGIPPLTDDVCFDSADRHGGLRSIGKALARGMVVVFSIWDAPADFMAWLDSGSAGPCASSAGSPDLIAASDPDAVVSFSNIRWGDIGATVLIAPNGSVVQNRKVASSSSSSSLSPASSSPTSSASWSSSSSSPSFSPSSSSSPTPSSPSPFTSSPSTSFPSTSSPSSSPSSTSSAPKPIFLPSIAATFALVLGYLITLT